jgi:lactoylglutathione lyase
MSGMNKVRARIARSVGMVVGLLLCVALPHAGSVAQAHDEKAPFIGFTKINVTNLERSIEFYTKIMGLKIAETTDFPSASETLLTRTGGDYEDTILLAFNKKRTEPLVHGNAFNNLTFVVDNFDEILARWKSAGYVVTGERKGLKSPVTYAKTLDIAFTKDPDGFVIEILQFYP